MRPVLEELLAWQMRSVMLVASPPPSYREVVRRARRRNPNTCRADPYGSPERAAAAAGRLPTARRGRRPSSAAAAGALIAL